MRPLVAMASRAARPGLRTTAMTIAAVSTPVSTDPTVDPRPTSAPMVVAVSEPMERTTETGEMEEAVADLPMVSYHATNSARGMAGIHMRRQLCRRQAN